MNGIAIALLEQKPVFEIIEKHTEYLYDPRQNIEIYKQSLLRRTSTDLDLFIEFLSRESPAIIHDFVDRYVARLSDCEGISVDDIDFEHTPKNISSFPEAFQKVRSVSLALLNYEKYLPTEEEGVLSISYWDWIRSYLIPAYLLAETYVKMGPRDEALKTYKRYVDHRTRTTKEQNEEKTTVEDYYRKVTSKDTPTHLGTWFLTNNGLGGSKVTKCMWVEILKGFEDPEIGYAVACHFDFLNTQYISQNFRLTRTKTLMEGDEMCDFCLHDTDISKEMKHPPKDFWKKLDE